MNHQKDHYSFIIPRDRYGNIIHVYIEKWQVKLVAIILMLFFGTLSLGTVQLWAYNKMRIVVIKDAEIVTAFQHFDKARVQQIAYLNAKAQEANKRLSAVIENMNKINATLAQNNVHIKGVKPLTVAAASDLSYVFERQNEPPAMREITVPQIPEYDYQLQTLMIDHTNQIFSQINDVAVRLGYVNKQTEQNVEKYVNYLSHVPTIWPAEGKLSAKFGWRRDPFMPGRWEYHKGIDIANKTGTPIYAVADGIVTYAGWEYGYGRTIVIDHGNNIKTVYAHLYKFKVKVGDKVKKGQVIALMGNSGRSTGPHLHFEIRINNIPVNPLKYLPRR